MLYMLYSLIGAKRLTKYQIVSLASPGRNTLHPMLYLAICSMLHALKRGKEKSLRQPRGPEEKRIPRAEAPCIPFTKRNKRKKSLGITRVTSSSPCLILVTRVEWSLLRSASGARKFYGARKLNNSSRLHVAFIDFKQAYDTIPREALWQHLRRISMPTSLLSVIQNLYADDEYVLKDGAKTARVHPTR
eukprot:1150096-Pelagomonas_calceolata.AAC.2